MERLTRFDGELTPCSCKRQPRHLHRFTHGGQHAVECPPCGTRTAFFPTVQEAVQEWEQSKTETRTA